MTAIVEQNISIFAYNFRLSSIRLTEKDFTDIRTSESHFRV